MFGIRYDSGKASVNLMYKDKPLFVEKEQDRLEATKSKNK
jgi:hypothetical protein